MWPSSEVIEMVIRENSALKLELERCYNKVAKSQKLEQEITKVHRAHEELAATCERREKLERAARMRLQSDCRRLTELNRALRDQIDLLSSRSESSPVVESMRKELTQRELLIGQLITQSTILTLFIIQKPTQNKTKQRFIICISFFFRQGIGCS